MIAATPLILSVIEALAGLATAATGFFVAFRKLNAIHVLVNQRLTDALTEIRNLRAYIREPDTQTMPPVGQPPASEVSALITDAVAASKADAATHDAIAAAKAEIAAQAPLK